MTESSREVSGSNSWKSPAGDEGAPSWDEPARAWIETRAEELWNSAGQPAGRSLDYWLRAEAEYRLATSGVRYDSRFLQHMSTAAEKQARRRRHSHQLSKRCSDGGVEAQ